MIPTNTLEELYKAELDLQRSQVSLIREMGRGHEKSRLHAGTLQAMSSALSFVQDKILLQESKVSVPAAKTKTSK